MQNPINLPNTWAVAVMRVNASLTCRMVTQLAQWASQEDEYCIISISTTTDSSKKVAAALPLVYARQYRAAQRDETTPTAAT